MQLPVLLVQLAILIWGMVAWRENRGLVRVVMGWGLLPHAGWGGAGRRAGGGWGRAARDAGVLWDANPSASLALGSGPEGRALLP